MNRKIILSLLVEDESGVLTRITNLFNKRGFFLESLTVGPSEVPGVVRLVLTTTGTSSTSKQIAKQLFKVINVLDIQNFTEQPAIQRELLLVKVKNQPQQRAQLGEVIQAFRAQIIDISDRFTTLEFTGDPDTINAIRQLMYMFDLVESSCTGRACLRQEFNSMEKF